MADIFKRFLAEFWERLMEFPAAGTNEKIYDILCILMLVASIALAFAVTLYLRKIKFLPRLVARLKNDTDNYNRLKKEQLRIKLEHQKKEVFSTKEKFSLTDRVFLLIRQTNLLEHLPGFTEVHLLILYGAFLLTGAFFAWRSYGFAGALLLPVFLTVGIYILMKFMVYERRERVEAQLSQFVNVCEGASSMHSDIIDIMGDVYDKVPAPLGGYLEDCYLEAKTTANRKAALEHLKERTGSVRFLSVIDNLERCSEVTGDYRRTIEDLRGPIRIHQSYKKRKKALVRNARVNITVMAVLGFVIFFAASGFIDGMRDFVFHTTGGLVILGFMGVLLLAGMTLSSND